MYDLIREGTMSGRYVFPHLPDVLLSIEVQRIQLLVMLPNAMWRACFHRLNG
jgi:hypothetical protein